jgi:hypothetical protein
MVDSMALRRYTVYTVKQLGANMSNLIFNLDQYVSQENAWRRIFGDPDYDLTKAEDRQALAERIDSQLSPENLTCDGEASIQHIRSRRKMLHAAAAELLELDPTLKFYEYS